MRYKFSSWSLHTTNTTNNHLLQEFTQLPSELFSLLAGQTHLQTPAAEFKLLTKCLLIYLVIFIFGTFAWHLGANSPFSGTNPSSLTTSQFPSSIIAHTMTLYIAHLHLLSYSVSFSTQTISSSCGSAPLEKKGRVCIVSNEPLLCFSMTQQLADRQWQTFVISTEFEIQCFGSAGTQDSSPGSQPLCLIYSFIFLMCNDENHEQHERDTQLLTSFHTSKRQKLYIFFFFCPRFGPHPRRHWLDHPYLSGLINYYRLHFIRAES